MQLPLLSHKASRFTESVIRGMSVEAAKYQAVNLAQGMPDFSAPDEIKEAACKAIQADINQYAITWGAKNLRYAIAEHAQWHLGLAIDPETEITVTCGSTEAMLVALLSMINPGDEVILSQPFYENYWPDCVLAGAVPRFVPLRGPDWKYDPDELANTFNDRTKAIVLCNPNNPTSTVVDPDELARFVAAVPKDILVVIDEAYVEYIRDGLLPDSLGLARAHPNVVVLRTFSKAYGLAGLRVGYAVGDPEIITALGKVYVPFTASTISQAAAIASLLAADELLSRTDAVVAERERVSTALSELGYTFPPSQANFVWLPLAERTVEFAQQAAESRVLVRPYGADGVRVTIGAPAENDAFLAFARQWING